jgi:subtilisin family serine protease
VSGNLGYGSQSGIPVAAFRTSYTRDSSGTSPQISVTMRQILMPGNASQAGVPMLRSVSASFDDRAQISDNLSLQYGFTLDSVSFVSHLNSFSPYARLVYSLGDQGEVALAYTSGNARPDLAGGSVQESDLQRDLNTLGLFPRMSLLNGRPKIQRGEDFELSYSRKMGSRMAQVSAYRESISNAALNLLAPDGAFSGDLLPDLFGNNDIFDAGDYQSTGYTAALTQNLGEHLSATAMYGTMGSLTAAKGTLASGSAEELRSMMRSGRQQEATVRIAATAPVSGTQMIASYQWTADRRAVMPGWLYSTQSLRPLPGLNLYVRQPIPGLSALPWRVEATADLRNLLAQGYLPLTSASGQPIVLVQMPRSFRGGLSFIF